MIFFSSFFIPIVVIYTSFIIYTSIYIYNYENNEEINNEINNDYFLL